MKKELSEIEQEAWDRFSAWKKRNPDKMNVEFYRESGVTQGTVECSHLILARSAGRT
jgi:hypothetical protein